MNNKLLYKNLTGLIDKLNSESTAAANINAESGIVPSKAGAFIMLKIVFIKHFFFKGGYSGIGERFIISIYYSLLGFLTDLKTLKLLNKL
jgi:hypothetical protein